MSDDLSGFSLFDLFRSEAESQLDLISTGLLGLEGVVDPSPTVVEPMMRGANSLKGAARIVGLDVAVGVAHALEDCFVAVQEQRCRLLTRHIDRLLQAVDLLTRISLLSEAEFADWAAAHAEEVEATVASLKSILTDQSDAPPTPPPPTEVTPASKPPARPATPPQDQDLSGFSLLDLFRSEAEGHTATISQGLLGLEGIANPNPATIEPMMRAAHSLKGAARIVGLDAAVGVAQCAGGLLRRRARGPLPTRTPTHRYASRRY